MGTYKGVLRYRDSASGLSWTVSAWRDATTPDVFQVAADLWNTAYLGCCNDHVKLVDLSIQSPALWGDMTVYPVADFSEDTGALAVKLCPLAEYMLLRADGTDENLGRSLWKLHGFDVSLLDTDGQLDPTLIPVSTLAAQSLLYFQQYRFAPTAHYPAITPPAFFHDCSVKGPYVRRLGNPFSDAGQRHRYTRTPAA
jgi:hypothetical protein